jgi:hypothetical protein
MEQSNDNKIVQLNLSLPKHDRDTLRKIAGKRMMDNPSKVESAASVGSEIIRKYLEEQERRARKERKEE